MYAFKMKPRMQERIWGGERLRTKFGKEIPSAGTGESWEISAQGEALSVVSGGPDVGKTIPQLIERYGEALLGEAVLRKYGTEFPLLVKFIDANDALSVQVHPGDEYARTREGQPFGKSEMWYIVEAEPGAEIVYGLKEEISREELSAAIAEGRLEEKLNAISVSAGDAFFIPAGLLHALGKGILAAEIQQSADLTYRLYDYGRVGKDGKPRTLHREKAAEVVRLSASAGWERADIDAGIRSEFFFARRFAVSGESERAVSPDAFEFLICCQGEGRLDNLPFSAGDCFLLPASLGAYSLTGEAVFLWGRPC